MRLNVALRFVNHPGRTGIKTIVSCSALTRACALETTPEERGLRRRDSAQYLQGTALETTPEERGVRLFPSRSSSLRFRFGKHPGRKGIKTYLLQRSNAAASTLDTTPEERGLRPLL